MKRFILFLIGLMILGMADAMAQEKSGARLRVEQPTHNFGDVSRRGGDLTREFSFTNGGDAPLVIMRVITSCSCLKANFPKRPVMPGENGVISITYEPHKSEPGVFNKVIRILSTSAEGEEVICVQGNSVDSARNGGIRRMFRDQKKPAVKNKENIE